MNWKDEIKKEELLKGLDSMQAIIEYLEDASEQENYSAELLRTVARKSAKALIRMKKNP